MDAIMVVSKQAAAASSPTALKISQTITLDNDAGRQIQTQTLSSSGTFDLDQTQAIESST
jgi:hypothetical protein